MEHPGDRYYDEQRRPASTPLAQTPRPQSFRYELRGDRELRDGQEGRRGRGTWDGKSPRSVRNAHDDRPRYEDVRRQAYQPERARHARRHGFQLPPVPVLAEIAGALALATVLVLVLTVSCSGQQEAPAEEAPIEEATTETVVEEPEAEVSNEPQNYSTPASEWKKGEMPFIYQTDPQFADVSYSNGEFAKQGCGPCALFEVYMYFTGDTAMTPVGMAEFATENGFSTDKNGSSWTLMSTGAQLLGLSSYTLTSVSAMQASLEEGRPLICVMNPGTFTDVGHYIVVERLDDDGMAIVHDSNSVERSNQTWELELILSEAACIWSMGLSG